MKTYTRNVITTIVIAFTAVVCLYMLLNKQTNRRAKQPASQRLNDGIAVEAPDNWRWVRDGIHLRHFLVLAGEPETNQTKGLNAGELGAVTYKSNIENVYHQFLFDSKGLLRFSEWYVNIPDDLKINSPKTAIKNNLKIPYPRMVPISWTGKSSNGYEIQVDIMYPDGQWVLSKKYYTSQNTVVHQHTGANAGRWRVRALSNKGGGVWSNFVEFKCIN